MKINKWALAFAAGFSICAVAGWKQDSIVSVIGNEASGYMGTARNTANNLEYIGCTVEGMASSQLGFCQAKTMSGVQASCVTGNSFMLDAMRSITSDSYIFFDWNTSGGCTLVTVGTYSFTPPK